MDITIYSESPYDGDVEKAGKLNFPSNILVSAKSLEEFRNLQKQYLESSKNIKNVGYWLSIPRDKGYWISPFADKKALNTIFSEIEQDKSNEPLQVMLDLEPSIFVNWGQLVKGIPGYFQKKARIREFMENAVNKGIEVVTAEYPSFLGSKLLQECAGIAFDPNKIPHLKSPMVYTSFIKPFTTRPVAKYLLKREARKGKKRYGDNFGVGLGCIARSGHVASLEKMLLPAEELKEDLQIIQDEGIKKAFIYSCRRFDLEDDYSKACHDVLKEFAE